MCISKNFSLLSFGIGLSGSLLLIKYGKPEYEKSNKVISSFYIFISFMQLIDYMIWDDLNCTKGLNKMASIAGPILNHLQPTVMILSSSYFMKSSETISKNNLLILNAIYLIYVVYNYYHYVKTTNLCTGTNEAGHLKWLWNNATISIFYLVILFLNTVNYYHDTNFMIASILLLSTLLISVTNFKKNIGELWCLLSVGIPYISLFLQHTVL